MRESSLFGLEQVMQHLSLVWQKKKCLHECPLDTAGLVDW